MTGPALSSEVKTRAYRTVFSAAALCAVAGCAYENVVALGADAITCQAVPGSLPSPSGSLGLDIEWMHLFGVSSFLSGGEALVLFQVAPELGVSEFTPEKREQAPGGPIPQWAAASFALRPAVGWWSWPDAPGGTGPLAGCRLAFGLTPYEPLGRSETLLLEYGFLWLFEVDGPATAHLQVVRVAYVCGF